MKDTVIKGCGTALVTPFIDGEVDYEAYAALVDRQVELGADFLVALATTGETPTLSAEEKVALLRLTHGLAGGRPVVVGCGSNSVPGTLANMKLLEPYDVDAWLVVVPFYNKPTQEGMYLYFKTIAESTEKPVIIYNVPGRTGANMTAQTCLRLAKDVPNIIGIKEASGKLDQVFEILDGAPEGFALLSGDDDLTLEMMKRGAAGCISVASNIVPGKVKALTDAALDGRFEDAALIDETLKPLYKACFIESNPVPVKAALSLMGLCTKEMRLPLTEASSSTVQLMQDIIQAF
ncbi:MAG: 4-hydroxy-tetrahydrodipicolinate synthase [Bacteroidales bacterium]|nr:4-hydroxy-tetrahydrodipicolinate synthase [Candidatus Cryptobacteroides choladohippi]